MQQAAPSTLQWKPARGERALVPYFFEKRKKRKNWELAPIYQVACLPSRPGKFLQFYYYSWLDLLLRKLLTKKKKDNLESTQEDIESHIQKKVTNKVKPSNIAKA